MYVRRHDTRLCALLRSKRSRRSVAAFFFVWLATSYYWLDVLWKTERPCVDIAQGSESRLGREGFRGWGKDGG
jgi:hypothetical protein